MQSQKRLREELAFITQFSTLFDVMQQAALSHLRQLEEWMGVSQSVTEVLAKEFLPLLPAETQAHRLVGGGGQPGRLLIALTSEEGFVGPLHTGVIRHAKALADARTQWVLIGQRGARLLDHGVVPVRVFPLPPEERAEEEMRTLARAILTHYTRHALRDVWLIAPRFISAARQDVSSQQLLPLPRHAGATRMLANQEFVVEPSLDRVVEALALAWVEAACVEAYWSARQAELAARAMQVEASRQELAKYAKTVRHEFFKTLHERLDVMVRETCVVQRQLARRAAQAEQSAVQVGG